MTSKTRPKHFPKIIPILLWLPLVLLASNVHAVVTNAWDPTGTTVSATPSGSWEGSTWAPTAAPTATPGTFQEGSFTLFTAGTSGSGTFTVTANANHTCAGIFNGGLTGITGGALTITGSGVISLASGAQGISTASGATTTISSVLGGVDGTSALQPSGSGQLFLNGVNTFSGGYNVAATSLINFNNSASFGMGPINWNSGGSGGAFIVEGSSAVNIPNNSVVNAAYTYNFVGNTAGVTYSGNWNLNANTFNIGCGGNVANVDIFSGVISGTGGIGRSPGQSPAGIVKFTGANTYTGKTTLQSGTTVVTSLNKVSGGTASSSLGAPTTAANGTISIGATTVPATLVYTGVGETTDRVIDLGGTTGGATIENDGSGALIFSSAGTASGAGIKTLTLQGTSTAANSISKIVNNSSANTTSVTKAQAGSWTLTGVNTYTGNTTISAGALTIGGAGQLNSGSYAGNIANSGTFTYNSSANTTISGIISGAGTITEAGSGSLILSGANTYTGKTFVTGGTLTLNNGTSTDSSLGTAPANYVADQLSLSGGTLSTGSALAGTLSANRGITLTGANTIALSSKDLTIPGNIVGTGSLTKSGANTVTLGGTNSFAGTFTIIGGGVNFNGTNTAGNSNIVVGPTTSAVTLRNSVTSSTVTNNITIIGGGTSDIDTFSPSGDSLTFSGTIDGSGPLLRGKGGGAGNVIITGSNTNFSGGITVMQGPLVIGNVNALGTGAFTVGPGSVASSVSANTPLTGANAVTNSFNIACTNKSFTIGGSNDLEFSGPINLGSTAGATSASITVANTGATIFSGPISGPAGIGLTNAGAGTLTVTGSANTYTGPTVVSGILKVTGNITSSSGVTVNSGGTLSGSGMVPAFAINSGGTISPGSSPGSIFTGAGTLGGGGHYKWEINKTGGTAGTDPGWDQINVAGGVNITATAGSPFVIDVNSLTSGDVAGSVSDFDNTTNYIWSIATTSAGLTNFDASEFSVTTAGFANSLGNGGFYVTNNSTDLLLGFAQKPIITDLEPVNPTVNAFDNITFTVTATGAGTLTYQWRKGGVAINGATNATYTISPVHGTDAGTYDVLVSNFAGPTASVGDVLTVTPINQTITFNPIADQIYGASVNLTPTASSGLTVSLSVLSGHATLTGNTLKITGVGPVSVQASQAGNADYNAASNVVQNFNANPATLTVSADNKFRPYGATNPPLTVTYTNFVNGDTLGTSDVAGSPVLTVGADTNSDVGNYPITNSIGTLTSTNYTFSLLNGTLTITNAVSTNIVTVDVNPALPGSNVTFTATLSTLAPSLAVPTNSIQLVIDGTNVGSPVFPTNGVAMFTNNSISHGNHTVAAAYGGDTNSLGATNILGSTNSLTELINTPPIAGPASYGRPRDIPLSIRVTDLLTNASDPDGDTVSLLSVGAVSTNGASILLTNGVVSYTPPTNNGNVTDTFTYTVSDTFGATNANLVTVTILPDDNGPSVNITGLTTLGDGTALISFAGIPNRNYLIQATTNLSPPISWTTIATNTAGTNGLFQYNDLNSTNFSSRYYRTTKP